MVCGVLVEVQKGTEQETFCELPTTPPRLVHLYNQARPVLDHPAARDPKVLKRYDCVNFQQDLIKTPSNALNTGTLLVFLCRCSWESPCSTIY